MKNSRHLSLVVIAMMFIAFGGIASSAQDESKAVPDVSPAKSGDTYPSRSDTPNYGESKNDNSATKADAKSIAPVAEFAGDIGSGPFQQPIGQIETKDVLLIESKDGLSAYSKSLGKWDRVIVALPKDGQARLKRASGSDYFCHVIIDDQLFGFSSQSGRWSNLKIPPEYVGQVVPQHRGQGNLLTVKIGDQTFALSPKTGEWTSSEGAALPTSEPRIESVDVREANQKLRLALDTPEGRRLTEEISKYELRASRLADKIRWLLKAKPIGEHESQKLVESRRELETALAKALELKSQIDQLRVRELQSRLSRMEQQIGRRQALRPQIIERRARELIEGEETEWNSESATNAVETIAQNTIHPTMPVEDRQSAKTDGATVTEPRVPTPQSRFPAETPVHPYTGSNLNVNGKDEAFAPSTTKKRPNEFFVMNEDGSELRSLFMFDGHPMVGSPAVSPDGQWIAFDDGQVGKQGREQIYVMRIDGTNPRNICSGMMPTWSNDSRFLACSRRDPRYGVWLVDTTTDFRNFIAAGYGAQMSPDGKRIAIGTISGYHQLATFDLETGDTKTIIGANSNPYIHITSNGTWSPDNQSYCFKGQRSNGLYDIVTVSMTGSDSKPQFNVHHSSPANIMTDFAWHPKGDRIIFSSLCPKRQNRKQLYEFNPNKSGSVTLVVGQDEIRNNTDMCWTPDGQRLIFISGDFCED